MLRIRDVSACHKELILLNKSYVKSGYIALAKGVLRERDFRYVTAIETKVKRMSLNLGHKLTGPIPNFLGVCPNLNFQVP